MLMPLEYSATTAPRNHLSCTIIFDNPQFESVDPKSVEDILDNRQGKFLGLRKSLNVVICE